MSIRELLLYFLPLSSSCKIAYLQISPIIHNFLFVEKINLNQFVLFYLVLGYFNLVMSYSPLSRTSREIALFSFTCISSYLLHMGYRLIDYQPVYFGYDNSTALLNDKFCTYPICWLLHLLYTYCYI